MDGIEYVDTNTYMELVSCASSMYVQLLLYLRLAIIVQLGIAQ